MGLRMPGGDHLAAPLRLSVGDHGEFWDAWDLPLITDASVAHARAMAGGVARLGPLVGASPFAGSSGQCLRLDVLLGADSPMELRLSVQWRQSHEVLP